jgi:hypothetical protein
MRHVLFFAALLLTLLLMAFTLGDASAEEWSQPIADQCAASFPERHADAISAITLQSRYMAEWKRVMPWFDQNCRVLSELERAIRKIDDPAAFVCRTQKGRPKELTSQFVLDHSQPADIVIFQDRYHDDDVCELYDQAERTSLVLRDAPPGQVLAAYCYGSTSPKCDKARAVLAAAEAKKKGQVSP